MLNRRLQMSALLARPWTEDAPGPLAVEATVEAFLAGHGALDRRDFHIEVREHRRRDYMILVDHSGSMVGRRVKWMRIGLPRLAMRSIWSASAPDRAAEGILGWSSS